MEVPNTLLGSGDRRMRRQSALERGKFVLKNTLLQELEMCVAL